MMDQELKNIWKEAGNQELVTIDNSQIIQEMKQQHKTIEQAILKRDKREIFVAVIMMPFFLGVGIMLPYTLTKIGAFLMLFALAFVIYKLKSVKKHKPVEANKPTQAYLEGLKMYYSMEMDLLKDIFYWYLAPLGICASLVYLGMPMEVLSKWIFVGVMLLMYTAIYFMNQSAVKQKYVPLLKQIDESLAALKKD